MQGTTVVAPLRDTGEAVRASLAGALATFLNAIPRLIAFAVILIVGWLLSSLLARGVAALLHAVKFNDLAERSGFAGFVHNMGVRSDSAGVIASVAKWFVRLIALVVAFDALGLPAVSDVLRQLLLWLPNLVVALVVLVIGGLAANALGRLVRGATAEGGFVNPDVISAVTRAAVWGFAIIVAVNQLGIATVLINTLLIGVVGALALASGLAFGLGGRDKAAALLDQWGRRSAAAGPKPKLERAAAAQRQTGGGTGRGHAVPATPVGTNSYGASAESGSRWVERSGVDRRAVPRAGVDRRRGSGSAA